MTLEQFIKKWKGNPVDFDGAYGAQCMDLMHQYVTEVLELSDPSILAAPAAKDVYNNFRWGKYFDKIVNTPNAVPERGDIIIWGGGDWGHIAIFVEGDVNTFTSFDQNYPVGSAPHLQEHTYENVLGWVRIKRDRSEHIASLENKINSLKEKLEDEQSRFKTYQKEQKKLISDLRTEIKKLEKELMEKTKTTRDYVSDAVKYFGPSAAVAFALSEIITLLVPKLSSVESAIALVLAATVNGILVVLRAKGIIYKND